MTADTKKETYIYIDASGSFSYVSDKNKTSPMVYALDAARDRAIRAKESRGSEAVYVRMWHEETPAFTGFDSGMSPGMIKNMSTGLGEVFARTGGTATFDRAVKQFEQEISSAHSAPPPIRRLVIVTDSHMPGSPQDIGRNLAALINRNPGLAVSFIISENEDFPAPEDRKKTALFLDTIPDAKIREKVQCFHCKPQNIKDALADILTEKPETLLVQKTALSEEDEIVTLLNIFQDAMSSAAETAENSRNCGELGQTFRAMANLAETLRNERQKKPKEPKHPPSPNDNNGRRQP